MKVHEATVRDVACLGCQRKDVKHKAKGLCANCYRMKFYVPKAIRLLQSSEPVDNDSEA